MKVPSLGQLSFAVLFFLVFFLTAAGGQYLSGRSQRGGILIRDLRQSGEAENKVISYNNGKDFDSYNQSWETKRRCCHSMGLSIGE